MTRSVYRIAMLGVIGLGLVLPLILPAQFLEAKTQAPASDMTLPGKPLPYKIPKPRLERSSFTPSIAARGWNKRGWLKAIVPEQYADALRKANGEKAERLAQEAIAIFLPGDCTLPRTIDGEPAIENPKGDREPFPHHWYHSHMGGARLMYELFRLYQKTHNDEYLQRVIGYAETMIEYGRDDERYGPKTSPLFASCLVLAAKPVLPEPFKNGMTNEGFPTVTWQGGHKACYFGCDPEEDAELYELLYLLSDELKTPRYKAAADNALRWWLVNTQQVNGLYPWGEHCDWNFREDAPIDHMVELTAHTGRLWKKYHELQPVPPAGQYTCMERHVLGLMRGFNYYLPESAGERAGIVLFSRHGELYGESHPAPDGEQDMWEKHLFGRLQYIKEEYLASKNPAFRKEMAAELVKFVKGLSQIARVYKCVPGVPFNADGTIKGGKNPNRSGPILKTVQKLKKDLGDAEPTIAAAVDELTSLCKN